MPAETIMADDIHAKPEALLVAARCPKCGGALGPAEKGTYACEYCGTSFLPGEVFAGKTVDLREFYEQAFAAAEKGDYDRAHEYFKRILETDSREYQAWVGKAIAGAYAGLSDTGRLETGEVLWCIDMALARYDGDDKVSFQCELADRVGALAVDLIRHVKNKAIYDEGILRALLDLLAYWEERGTEELECWTATVAVAETPVVTRDQRSPVVTAFAGPLALLLLAGAPTYSYPFEDVAREYKEKIRAKYAPTFPDASERNAGARSGFEDTFQKWGKIIIIAGVIAIALIGLIT